MFELQLMFKEGENKEETGKRYGKDDEESFTVCGMRYTKEKEYRWI